MGGIGEFQSRREETGFRELGQIYMHLEESWKYYLKREKSPMVDREMFLLFFLSFSQSQDIYLLQILSFDNFSTFGLWIVQLICYERFSKCNQISNIVLKNN